MKRLYVVAMSLALAACGAAGGDSLGDEPSADPDPSATASATKPKPTKASTPDTATEADAAPDATDPDPEPDPTPDPEPDPTPDAAPPPPDAAPPPPDATPDAAPPPPVCPGFERIHVAVGTCVKATNCTGYILVGGDVSLGAGAAAFPPGSEIPTNVPDPCVSNDQDACVRYKHPSTSNPKAFDVFIKPNAPTSCKVTTYEFVNGVCPVNAC